MDLERNENYYNNDLNNNNMTGHPKLLWSVKKFI